MYFFLKTQFFIIAIWVGSFSDIYVWKYSYIAQVFSSETKILTFIFVNFVYRQRKGYIKIKEQYMHICNILFNQVYEKVIFFEDQVYDCGRFKKTNLHTRTQITPPPPTTYEDRK